MTKENNISSVKLKYKINELLQKKSRVLITFYINNGAAIKEVSGNIKGYYCTFSRLDNCLVAVYEIKKFEIL